MWDVTCCSDNSGELSDIHVSHVYWQIYILLWQLTWVVRSNTCLSRILADICERDAYRTAVCCSVLQCVAVCCICERDAYRDALMHIALLHICISYCSHIYLRIVLLSHISAYRTALTYICISYCISYCSISANMWEICISYCSVLQCVAVCCSVIYVRDMHIVLLCVAVRCSVLQCDICERYAYCTALCCSVLQCAAVCCSVLYVREMHIVLFWQRPDNSSELSNSPQLSQPIFVRDMYWLWQLRWVVRAVLISANIRETWFISESLIYETRLFCHDPSAGHAIHGCRVSRISLILAIFICAVDPYSSRPIFICAVETIEHTKGPCKSDFVRGCAVVFDKA